jgi:methyltransferase (TIGR00027 family)
MRVGKPSASAQTVATVRAHLTWMGIVDDPLAHSMLRPRARLMARMLRRWPGSRYAHSPSFSFLAARTRFFDEEITRALDHGITQVGIIGAGYDTRAWRLARPGVDFFEVDHPATQRDKQQRAPIKGPRYVPVDLCEGGLAEQLVSAGIRPGAASVFILEGLTMYLSENAVTTTLSALAAISGPGSRMAANFTISGGGPESAISRGSAKLIRASWALSGEQTYRWLKNNDVSALLSKTGWTQQANLPGPMLVERYLTDTELPVTGLNSGVFCIAASRTA